MGVNKRLDVQELETVTCTSILAAPADELNFMQVNKFLNLFGGTIFYGGLLRLLDRHFMGVVRHALRARFFFNPGI